jgi:amidohydrolase
MIADGALADPRPDVILGYHNWPQLPAGTVGFHPDAVMASSDAFDVTLRGSAGHGAHPHLAIDTIAGAAQFISQIQTIVSREIAPSSAAVISIGQINGGTARNVIAAEVVLKGGVRTVEPGIAEKVEAAMRRMLDGLKTGMRLDYTLAWKRAAPVLRNNPAVLARYVAAARDALGPDKVIQMPAPSMGSEDFAWMAELIPAGHLRIGSRIDGLDTAIHRANYDCNDLAIATGVRVVSRAVADLLAAPL